MSTPNAISDRPAPEGPFPLTTEETIRQLPSRLEGATRWVRLDTLAAELGATLEPVEGRAVRICFAETTCAELPLADNSSLRREPDGTLWVPLRTVPALFQRRFVWDSSAEAFRAIPDPAAGLGTLRPGDPMPEVVLPDLEGNLISLGSFRGRHRVIFTWASW